MSRERGRVVAVGLVPFGLPREIAYAKELRTQDLSLVRTRALRRGVRGERDSTIPPVTCDGPKPETSRRFFTRWSVGRCQIVSVSSRTATARRSALGAYDMLVSNEGPRPLGIVIRYPDEGAAAPPTAARDRTGDARVQQGRSLETSASGSSAPARSLAALFPGVSGSCGYDRCVASPPRTG